MSAHTLSILQWKILALIAKPHDNGEPRRFNIITRKHGDGLNITANIFGEILAPGVKAAKDLIGSPFVSAHTDQWGTSYRITELGLAEIAKGKPAFVPPPAPVLRERDWRLLRQMATSGYEWHRPLDLGGGNGSFHSGSLYKLVLNGYAQMTNWNRREPNPVTGSAAFPEPTLTHRGKGSRRFAITKNGLKALASHKPSSD